MRFIMLPIVFYPLALLVAGLVILFGIEPQRWPREPRPVAGAVQEQALVLGPTAFDAPSASPEQQVTVIRDFWGRPLSLRIAVLPNQPNPTPAERGVRILLTPEAAAMIADRPVVAEVSYNPLSINAASGLAVSLQGIAPAEWVTEDMAAQPGVLRFTLPPQMAVDAIGFRAISANTDQAYGLEITNVRLLPQS